MITEENGNRKWQDFHTIPIAVRYGIIIPPQSVDLGWCFTTPRCLFMKETHLEATDAEAATCVRREGSAVSTTNSFTLVRADPACDDTTSRHVHGKAYIPQVKLETENTWMTAFATQVRMHLWIRDGHCFRILFRSIPGELHLLNFSVIKLSISKVSPAWRPPYCSVWCKNLLWKWKQRSYFLTRLISFWQLTAVGMGSGPMDPDQAALLCHTYPHTPSRGCR